MNRTRIGWTFVAAQAVLLIALVVVPGGDDWPTTGPVAFVGSIVLGAGFAIMVMAAATLGRSLTPTPVPVDDGQLSTGGLYRFARHPIYTGVLTIVAGLTIRSGSWIHLAIAAATVAFFNTKAAWEERQLAERYDEYEAYAARTPRFVPRLRRLR